MILRYLEKSTSLNNLKKNNVSGQIATLLILVIVVMLCLIMVTVNLGNLSVTATNMSNTADSSALFLASQLSSKAYQLWDSLEDKIGDGKGTTKKCVKKGLLGLILAIVVAIIVIVVAPMILPASFTLWGAILTTAAGDLTMAGSIAAGAIGGMLGGAIGGQIAGTGALQGAVAGAAIGAAIGLAAGGIMGAEMSGPINASAFAPVMESLLPTAGAPQIALGSLSVAAHLYNAFVDIQMTSDAFKAAAKALNGLPEYDRIRESVFLQALSGTIDDPSKTQDINDSDGDGDTLKKVPYFQFWWERRVEQLKQAVPELRTTIENFIKNHLSPITDTFEGEYFDWNNSFFARKDDKRPDDNTTYQNDGALVSLCKDLENVPNPKIDVSFYKEGVPSDDNDDCPDYDQCAPNDAVCKQKAQACAASDYFDEIDAVKWNLGEFVVVSKDIREQDTARLTSTWQQWVKWYYDPVEGEDYYEALDTLVNGEDLNGDGDFTDQKIPVEIKDDRGKVIDTIYEDEFQGLKRWRDELVRIKAEVPSCPCTTEGGCSNQGYCIETLGPRIDNVVSEIDRIISVIDGFRKETQAFYNTMVDTSTKYLTTAIDCAGNDTGVKTVNPVTYPWNDSRGHHCIVAEVGPFKIAYIKKKKYGNFLKGKICMELRDYSDDGTNAWVSVTRRDPHDQNIESGRFTLGRWNPALENGIFRRSRAGYSYNYVNLARKEKAK